MVVAARVAVSWVSIDFTFGQALLRTVRFGLPFLSRWKKLAILCCIRHMMNSTQVCLALLLSNVLGDAKLSSLWLEMDTQHLLEREPSHSNIQGSRTLVITNVQNFNCCQWRCQPTVVATGIMLQFVLLMSIAANGVITLRSLPQASCSSSSFLRQLLPTALSPYGRCHKHAYVNFRKV